MGLKLFDGKNWIDVGGGGGGTGHTHPNLGVLNSITQAMLTAWNTASDWVTTNGASILSHIADTLLHLPSGGTAGQVLKKTASGAEWSDESGGGGGAVLTNVGNDSRTVTFQLNGATGVLVRTSYNSREYSCLIPVDWMTSSNKNWSLQVPSNYIALTVKNVNGTCTISANYNLTCYLLH